MTIKEVESRTGMTRPNIRYYEKEGLLDPSRHENGYRDYTEQDVRTLLKIKLLRQLHVPVEEIRALSEGMRTLDETLDEHLKEIGQERMALVLAEDLCRVIRQDRVTYQTLEPDLYLSRIPRETPRERAFFSLEKDRVQPVAYPWRRYFARMFDFALYRGFWILFASYALRVHPLAQSGMLHTIFSVLLMLLVEPLLLLLFRTTPGKAIFGLRLTSASGGRLSYWSGLTRTTQLLLSGMGLCIPLYEWVRLWKSYRACKDGEWLPWESDDAWDDVPVYTIRDTAPWRGFAWAAASAAVLAIFFFGAMQSQLPMHRGKLTVAQFVENYNDMARFWDADSALTINQDGQLYLSEDEPGSTSILASVPVQVEVATEDGFVKSVSLTIESADQGKHLSTVSDTHRLLMLAFAGADVSFFSIPTAFFRSPLCDFASGSRFDTGEVRSRGFLARRSAVATGYSPYYPGNTFLVPLDSGTQDFRGSFLLVRE